MERISFVILISTLMLASLSIVPAHAAEHPTIIAASVTSATEIVLTYSENIDVNATDGTGFTLSDGGTVSANTDPAGSDDTITLTVSGITTSDRPNITYSAESGTVTDSASTPAANQTFTGTTDDAPPTVSSIATNSTSTNAIDIVLSEDVTINGTAPEDFVLSGTISADLAVTGITAVADTVTLTLNDTLDSNDVISLAYAKATGSIDDILAPPSFVGSFSVASQDTTPTGLAFSDDGTKMFVVGFAGIDINEYALSAPFDISTASFVDSFSVDSQDTFPADLAFSANGTKMFVIGLVSNDVHEYTLTAPFDVSTSSFVDSFQVSQTDISPRSLAFSNDGTKMFVLDIFGGDSYVNEYTLNGPFDVSTVTFVDSFSVASHAPSPQGLAFSDDGTKMFVSSSDNDAVIKYALTSPFDVSTASFVDSFSVSSQGFTLTALAFSDDGTRMFVLENDSNAVYEYALSEPFTLFPQPNSLASFAAMSVKNNIVPLDTVAPTITAAAVTSLTEIVLTYSENIDVTTTNGEGFTLSVGGTVSANSDPDNSDNTITLTVSGITTSDRPDITYSAESGTVTGSSASTSAASQTFTGTTDNAPPTVSSVATAGTSTINIVLSENVTINGAAPEDFALSGTISTDPAVTGITAVANNAVALALDDTLDSNDAIFLAYTKATGSIDDIPLPPLVGSFPVGIQDSGSTGLAFSNDGTRMFVVGTGSGRDNDAVHQYTLSAAFDVSTASFVDSFSVGSQDTLPTGVALSTDGTKMFVVGSFDNNINEYTLSTAFDVSTASFVDSFSVASQDILPLDMAFSGDGTKMFVLGGAGDDINEYTLSAPFDVSNVAGTSDVTFVDSFSVSSQDISPRGLAFSADGTRMFVVGSSNDAVYGYALTPAFDVSTAAFVDSFSVASQDTFPQGLALSADGTRIFVLGNFGENVHQYALSEPFTLFQQPNSLASFAAMSVTNNIPSDTTPPTITAATVISLTEIVLTYSENIDVTTTNGEGFTLSVGTVSANTDPDNSDSTITLTVSGITASDAPNVTYTESDGSVTGSASNPAASQTFTGTTPLPDTIPPEITAAAVTSLTEIVLTYSENIDVTTTNGEGFTLSTGTVTANTDPDNSDSTITLTVSGITTSDAPNVTYTESDGTVADTASNPAADQTFAGTTPLPDTIPPTITAAAVTSLTEILLTYSENIDVTTTNGEGFTLSTGTVSANTDPAGSDDTITLTVSGITTSDTPNVTYTESDGSVTDSSASNPAASQTFTGTTDDAPPTVLSIVANGTSTINIVLSEDVTINGAAPEDFALSGTISTDPAVTGITAVTNNTVALALDDTLDSNDAILLAYTKTTGSIDDIPLPPLLSSFPVDLQDSESTGMAFSNDGTRMFVVGTVNDAVYEYALATPFDVSTATFVDSFSVASQDTVPRGLAFSADGTKMFVVGDFGDDINEYTLTTPFDVSTATFVDSFPVASQDRLPQGLAFSADGTKMFVVGTSGDAIYEYTLTTAFDVSTATFVDSFPVASQDTAPRGLAFSANGTRMFVVGSDNGAVYGYTLTTPFDVSTASFVDSFSVTSQDRFPRGLALSADGTRIFVLGDAGGNVHQYALSEPFTLFQQPASLASFAAMLVTNNIPSDTIPPTITAVAVTSLTEIVLTYSENIDVTTTNGEGFTLSVGTVSANSDPDNSDSTITLTVSGITASDAPDVTYTESDGTVADTASNPAASQTFTGTTPLPDTIPPTITAAAVTSLTEILLTYSENIGVTTTNGEGFTLSTGTVSANTDPDNSDSTITLTVSGITASDAPNVTYTESDGTVADTASNPAADQTFAGTTPLPDTIPPTITAAAVTSLTEILLTYSENIDVTTTNGEGFTLSVGQVSANSDPDNSDSTITLTVSGITTSDAPDVTYTESDGTVADTASNPAADQTFAGTTPLPDTIPPTITAAAVTSLTEILLTYSENIDVTTTNGEGFTLSTGTVTANTDPDNSDSTITLTVSGITASDAPDVTYTESDGTVADTASNPAADQTFAGTTPLPDTIPPTITAAAVTSLTEILLTYSENIGVTTTNGEGFTLSTGTVSANTDPDNSDSTITLTVSGITASDAPDVTYTESDGTVADTASNPAADQTFAGTTPLPDTIPPTITAAAVTSLTEILLTYSENIGVTTTNGEGFTLSTGTVSANTDPAGSDDTITLTVSGITASDAPNVTYTESDGSVTDGASNPAADQTFTGTTPLPDTIPPTITAAAVTSLTEIVLTYSENIDVTTTNGEGFTLSVGTVSANSDPAGSDDTITLTVSGITTSDRPDITYSAESGTVTDSSASTPAASQTFTGTTDNVPPTVSSIATADTSTINIVLSEDVTINDAAPEDFALSGTISTDPAVTGITAVTNNTVALALDDTLDSNDAILLAYTKTTGSIDDIPLPPLDGSFPVGLQDSEPTGLTFSNDGTRMFVVGTGSGDNDAVNQYALTTAFDVSTASFVDSFPVASQDGIPRGLAFSADGTKMFVVGDAGNDINEYTLTTAFDVSTASFVDSFPVASQDTAPRGLAFSTDGTKMFVVGDAGNDINEYTLTTPFDVSTASFVDSFPVASQDIFPRGLALSADGTKMFVVGGFDDDINEYTLTTPFDVSTASFVDSFPVRSQDTAPTDLAFSADGTRIFVLGGAGENVHQYALPEPFTLFQQPNSLASFAAMSVKNNIPSDTTPPTITAAAVTSLTEIVLTYSENIDVTTTNGEGFTLSTGTVSANTDPDNSDDTITLTVSGITASDAPNVIYTESDGTVTDSASNPAASQTFAGTTPLPDTIPPTITAAAVTFLTEIVLTYSEDIDVTTTNGEGFTLSVGQVSANSDPDNSGNTITLTVSGITTSDTPNVIYTESDGTVTDSASNPAADQTFTGTTPLPDTIPPEITAAAVTSLTEILLTYSEDIDVTTTNGEGFTLSVGQVTANTDPDNSGNTITLTVSGIPSTSHRPDVTYAASDGSVTDSASNPAASQTFTGTVDDAPPTVSSIATSSTLTIDIVLSEDVTNKFAALDDFVLSGTISTGPAVTEITAVADTVTLTLNDMLDSNDVISLAYTKTGGSIDDISLTSFTDSFSVLSQELSPQGLAFSNNGTRMFVVGDSGDDINEYALAAPFDVSTASYDSSFSVASRDESPRGLAFSANGTKMFVVGDVGDDVNEYTLTAPFDISNAVTFVDSFPVASQDTSPQDLAFSNDGTRMFVVGDIGNDIIEYALSAPFDVSTASYDSVFLVGSQETSPRGLAFSNDGTRMFVTGDIGNDVNEYALTTAFDVSTASFDSSFSVDSQDSDPQGLAFSNDGIRMFVVGGARNTVNEYVLSDPFTLFPQPNSLASFDAMPVTNNVMPPPAIIASSLTSATSITLTYSEDIDVTTTDGQGFTLSVGQVTGNTDPGGSDDTITLTVSGITNTSDTPAITYTASLGSVTDTESNPVADQTFDRTVDDAPPTVSSIATSGTSTSAIDVVLSEDVTISGATPEDFVLSGTISTDQAVTGITALADTVTLTLNDPLDSDDVISLAYTKGTGSIDDISLTSFVDSFSTVFQDISPQGLAFSGDGTKMFVAGGDTDTVYEYALAVPFDVSTVRYNGNSFSVASQDTSPQGLAFSNDGTRMFVVGNSGDDINEYTLTTAFDVSTASFVDSFSVASQDESPQGLAFSNDGTRMFVAGLVSNAVYEYALTSPFDVSTASYDNSFPVGSQDTSPQGLAFSNDGTRMFVAGDIGNDVNEYTLAAPFDVSTATFVDSFSLATSSASSPQGLAFSNDGTRMFVADFDTFGVHEYALSKPFALFPQPNSLASFAATLVTNNVAPTPPPDEIDPPIDTTPPTITAAAVTSATEIVLTYSEDIDVTTTDGEGFTLSVGQVSANTDPAGSDSTITLTVSGITASDTPDVTYTESDGTVTDTASNPAASQTFTGTTPLPDTIPPEITAAAVTSLTEIVLTYSEDIDVTTTNGEGFTLSVGQVSANTDPDNSDSTITLTVSGITASDTPNVTYTESDGSVTDTASNPAASQTFTGTTPLPDTIPPTITAVAVTSLTEIVLTYSENIDVTTTNGEGFTLSVGTVTANSDPDNSDNTITLTVSGITTSDTPNVTYTESDGSVTDGVSNPAASQTFTGTTDDAPPTVLSIVANGTSTINIVLSENVTINGAAPEDFVLSGTISTDPAVTGITAVTNNTVALALDDTLDSNDDILLAYTKTTGSIDDIPLLPLLSSFPVGMQDSESTGLAFSNDGTRMFVVSSGRDNDAVHQYTLTAAFDVSTATFVDFFSVASQDTFPSGLAFSADGTKMFVVGDFDDDINEYTLTTAFDVSTASFVDSFSVSSQDTSLRGLAFSDNGTKMFVVGTSGDAIYEYTLTTAFDVSTASFVDSFPVASQDTSPRDMALSADGTRMFVVGSVNDAIYEYTLATPFDISTATFVDSSSVAAQDRFPAGLAFSADGTRIFVLGGDGENVHQYALSEPFTLFQQPASLASFAAMSVTNNIAPTPPPDEIDPSIDTTPPTITAAAVTSLTEILLTYSEDIDVTTTNGEGFALSTGTVHANTDPAGTADTITLTVSGITASDAPDVIYTESDGNVEDTASNEAASQTFTGTTQLPDTTPPTITAAAVTSATSITLTYSENIDVSTTNGAGFSLSTGQVTANTNPDNSGNTITLTVSGITDTSDTPVILYTEFGGTVADTASNPAADQTFYRTADNAPPTVSSIATAGASAIDITLSEDIVSNSPEIRDFALSGTISTDPAVIGIAAAADTVTLLLDDQLAHDDLISLAYTKTTGSIDDIPSPLSFVDSFSVASQDGIPYGLAFSNDGTRMFVTGNDDDDINEYALTTPFDLSNVAFVDSFPVASQDTSPQGLAFSNNGTTMFVVGNIGNDVNEYTLTAPFDVSTASFVDAFSVESEDTIPRDIAFSNNGYRMFVLGVSGNDVNEYHLLAPFNIHNATFIDSFPVISHASSPQGLAFSADGTGMFVVAAGSDAVIKYTLAAPFDVSTASFDSSFSVVSQETASTGLAFSNDGTRMFVLGNGNDAVYQYALSEPFALFQQPNSLASFAATSVTNNIAPPDTVAPTITAASMTSATSMTLTYSENVDVTTTDGTGFSLSVGQVSANTDPDNSDDTITLTVSGITTSDRPDVIYAASDGSVADSASNPAASQTFTGTTDDAPPTVSSIETSSALTIDVVLSENVTVNGAALDDFALSGTISTGPAVTAITAVADTVTLTLDATLAHDDVISLAYTKTTGSIDDILRTSFVGSFSVASQDGFPFGLAFSADGTKMFVVGESGNDINEYTLTTAFDVSTASFVDSFSVESQDVFPQGLAFSNDGTKMFVVGESGNDINEYTLTTAFDVSTASFVDSFSVESQDEAPSGLAFSNDGTKMFVVGKASEAVFEYTLTAPFDVSTASFDSFFSISSQDVLPSGLAFSADGTKMFVLGDLDNDINEYTLTTPFDVSTASFVDSFPVVSQDVFPQGLAFSNDGTKMFVLGTSSDAVHQYALSDPFTLSPQPNSLASFDARPVANNIMPPPAIIASSMTSATSITLTYSEDIDVTTTNGQGFSLSIGQVTGNTNPAGSGNTLTLTVSGITDTSDTPDITYTDSLGTVTGTASNPAASQTFTGTTDDAPPTVFSIATSSALTIDVVLSENVTVNGAALDDFALSGTISTNPTVTAITAVADTVTLTLDATLAHDDAINLAYTRNTGSIDDILRTSFVGSFSVESQDEVPSGLAFSADGTKMFIVGGFDEDINEYTLTTPFDVSTASFVDSFSVASQDAFPRGLAFSNDGTKMFVVGGFDEDINEYTLTTPFDVSTASFVDSFSVASQDEVPSGLAFSNDGTKMFVVGESGIDINEYTLTTAFDVSTASFVDSFSVSSQDTFPRGLAFSNDGTKMFVVGDSGNDINEYTLTTAFDVSTASFVDSFSVSSQDTFPSGLAFSNDGTKMFVLGTSSDAVHQYALSDPFTLSPQPNSLASFDAMSVKNNIASPPDEIDPSIDTTPPTITAAAVTSLTEITLTYSENIDVTTTNGAGFALSVGQVTANSDPGGFGNTITLTVFGIAASDTPAISYTASDGSVTDTASNPAANQVFAGTTALPDTIPPTITAAAVTSLTEILLTYSENIDVSTTDGAGFTLSDGQVTANTDPAGSDDTITLTVSGITAFDAPNVIYTESDGSVTDTASNQAEDQIFTGTTAPPDTIPPTITAAAVTSLTEIVLTYSENIDVSTTNGQGFTLSTGQVTANTDPAGSGNTIILAVSGITTASDAPNVIYTESDGSVTDTASNPAEDQTFAGTTAGTMLTVSSIGTAGTSTIDIVLSEDVTINGAAPEDFALSGTISTDPVVTGITAAADTVTLALNDTLDSNDVINLAYARTTGSIDNISAPPSFVDSFSVVLRGLSPLGLAFSADGTKMFVIDSDQDMISEYTLAAPFDVSTSSLTDFFSVRSQDTRPQDLAFSNDGTRMFVVGNNGTDVNEYTLTAPFNISDPAFVDSFPVISQDTKPRGLAFSADGTRMFVVGNDGTDVNEYALTAPFDVSTSSFVDSFSVASQDTRPWGLAFSADGTKMFVIGLSGTDVNEYALTAPFDVSTSSFVDSFPVASQDTKPRGLAFSADGKKMFVVGNDGTDVNEYTLSKPFTLLPQPNSLASFAATSVKNNIAPTPPPDDIDPPIDTTPPTITAAAVTSLTEILLTYSENIDVTATNGEGFTLSDGGTVTANTDPDNSGNTITLTVSGITDTSDAPNVIYTESDGSVTDTASNPAADQTFTGTTPLPDNIPPTITAAAVTSLTEILLTYSENIGVTTTNGEGFALSDGGTVSANTDPAGTSNTITLTVSGITDTSDTPNVIYTESDGSVTDTASNPAASQTFTGTTPLPDTIPPTITAASMISATHMTLTYSENIDVTATNGEGFALSDGGTVSANTDPAGLDDTITLTVSGITDTSDTPAITYTDSLGTVTGTASNPAANQTFTGTTDNAPPTVSSIATAGTSTINIVLSEDVTINGAAPEDFALSGTISTDPAITEITAIAAANTVTLTLDATLDHDDVINLAYTKTTGSIDDILRTSFVDSFPVGSEEEDPRGLAFSNDGTKVFVVGDSGNDVNEYTLTTAFDVSTAAFVDSFSVADEDAIPIGLAFSANGTGMFVVGDDSNEVYQYTLTAPFDVSTATLDSSLLVALETASPRGLAFSNDGTKMFVLSFTDSVVYQYALTAPFDVSTAVSASFFSVASQASLLIGLAFSADGTGMFVTGADDDKVYQYALSTPFDVGTAAFVDSFSVISQDTSPRGLAFSNDGMKMFVVGDDNNSVYQYALPKPFTLSPQPNSLASFAATLVTNNNIAPPVTDDTEDPGPEPERKPEKSGRSGGGGGGGGGGGSGRTGVNPSGEPLSDIELYGVSWNCETGLIRIITGDDSSTLSVSVRTSIGGLAEASLSDERIPGSKVFTSHMGPSETYLGILLVDIAGRDSNIRNESISIKQCVGEKTYDDASDTSKKSQSQSSRSSASEGDMTCKPGFTLVKNLRDDLACLLDRSVQPLMERGWVESIVG